MKMTEEEAIAYLRTFNAWRCGDESQEAPTPSVVTEAIRTVCDALEAQPATQTLVRCPECGHVDSPYEGTCRRCEAKLAQPTPETAGDARDAVVIHRPLPVFSDGPWIFTETGQKFTGDELNVEAFCRYRNALLAAPVPYGFGHLPQVATEDMQDNMRTALIDQGWTSDSAGEVDFQDIWDAAVVQFMESAEDAYAAILAKGDAT